MTGISPSLPLRLEPTHIGFALNPTMLDVVKQNFKNLMLTSPGERMMIPDFGAGIRNFLFEQNNPLTHSAIRSKIDEQLKKYMPFVAVSNVQISDDSIGGMNGVQIVITYGVAPLGFSDVLVVQN